MLAYVAEGNRFVPHVSFLKPEAVMALIFDISSQADANTNVNVNVVISASCQDI